MRLLLAATTVIVLATPALADSDAALTGFVTSGTGELTGRVTDLDNKPVRDVKVHVAPNRGVEQIVTTDRDGKYRAAKVGGDYAYVYVEATVNISGQVGVAVKDGEAGPETVEMHETLGPAVQAKALSEAIVPDYSKLAEDKNTWTRAWLLLDINATGDVIRVNLLDKPGLDLDKIAVAAAFKLKFEPARDRANRKIPAMVIWTFEWPPYFWLLDHQVAPHKLLPNATSPVVCRGTGPALIVRDCSRPTMAHAMTEPWFTKP